MFRYSGHNAHGAYKKCDSQQTAKSILVCNMTASYVRVQVQPYPIHHQKLITSQQPILEGR